MRVRRPIPTCPTCPTCPSCRACRTCRTCRTCPTCPSCPSGPSGPRMALRTECVTLLRVATAGRLDFDLERVGVLRAVRGVAVRAGRLSALKATGLHDRLWAIEPARAAIGPEVALRIVVGDRLAHEKRQRVILVVVARLETEECVVLVAVAVAARVEDLPRLGALGREHAQDPAEIAILRCVVERRLAGGIFLPLVHQRDVRLAGAVARLTSNTHLGPGRRVSFCG